MSKSSYYTRTSKRTEVHGKPVIFERCSRCFMPATRPGSVFIDGVCGACRNFDTRANVNWDMRETEFDELLKKHKRKAGYDCLLPVSGGKDSHRIVHEVMKRGMKPLLCTVTDSFGHTDVGTFNLRNLITQFKLNHYQYTISHDLFVRATRHAFETTGEALKFVEYAIYTIPVKLAQAFDIGLVIFGENSSFEYGSTDVNSANANPSVAAMNAAIGSSVVYWQGGGITEDEVLSLTLSSGSMPEVRYLSYYYPWSSNVNLDIARQYGFLDLSDEWKRRGTIEDFEQIDSKAYMIHLWLKYPKFGFQRVADIASRRVREGLLNLDEAKRYIKERDHLIDDIALKDFCDVLGYSQPEFWRIVYTAKWCRFSDGLGA
jgi:N-acetyl sugar amidotransferase